MNDSDDERQLKTIHLKAQSLTITSADGTELHGHIHENALHAGTKAVLFLGATASPLAKQADQAAVSYAACGISLMAVNYRPPVASNEPVYEQKMLEDAHAMFTWLVTQRGLAPNDIVIHGRGAGASVAAALANHVSRQQPVAGLVLDRPVTHLAAAVTPTRLRSAGFRPMKTLPRNPFSPKRHLKRLSPEVSVVTLLNTGRHAFSDVVPARIGRTSRVLYTDPHSVAEDDAAAMNILAPEVNAIFLLGVRGHKGRRGR